MNNQKVQNPKTETPKTIELNDKDMITDLLATEKNMNVNFAIALNEASNEILCQKLMECANQIRNAQRSLYELTKNHRSIYRTSNLYNRIECLM